MARSLMMVPIAALLIASTSWAEGETANYGRPGWYAGVGAGTGIAFLDSFIGDVTGDTVQLDAGGSFNARGGYRLTSWLAIEALYEGVYSSGIEIGGVKSAAERTTHSLVANLKFILPTWRVHPYFLVGAGAQYADFNGNGPFDGLDTVRWDPTVRIGLGIDGYITENWLVNLELAPSMRFADYVVLGETTDNVLLTVGLGVQYRW